MEDKADPHEVPAPFVESDAASVANPVSASGAGYVKCSLCNNIIDEEAAHVAAEHRHLQHIHEMLLTPLTESLQSTTDAALHAVGVFAVSTSQSADRGPDAFAVIQRAQLQLHRLLDGMQDSHGYVYAFGSVVSMGSWDGVGDGDFAFIEPKWFYTPAPDGQTVVVEDDNDEEREEEEEEEEEEKQKEDEEPIIDDDASEQHLSHNGDGTAAAVAHEALAAPPPHLWATEEEEGTADTAILSFVMENLTDISSEPAVLNGQILSAEREKRMIRNVTARLRDAGFRFEELDPVLHTRIPVVRRKRPTHDPLNLRAMHGDHLIRVRFDRPDSEEQFRRGRLHTLLSTYNARELPQDARGSRGRQLVLAVPDSCDAVHLMSRRERVAGVRKEWVVYKRTPEIFAIDFDLSCRYHGIRNSWLLRRYFEQDAVFRVGNVFLKKWSKVCGINNSRVGFLTSYAISVLWVYFLLRRGAVTFVDPDDVPVLPDPEQQLHIPYIPLWPPLDDAAADAARTTRLGALLRDFFYFYGSEFDWATQVVTIRQPCPTAAEVRTKADLNWLTDDALSLLLRDRCYHICSIEDVYEDDLDLGRHLTADKAAWTQLQFRLAYERCSGERPGQLMRLLDVPRKRANDVLRARLFRYLLQDTDSAASTVGELVACLCCEDTDSPREDPLYLLTAYELGNRLSDLWYDAAHVTLDAANHKKYDRRADLFHPPENPTEHGEWGLLCTDPLPAEVDAMGRRSVRLEPPTVLTGRVAAQGAPKRQRELHLTKARNQYAETTRLFAVRDGAEKKAKHNVGPAAVVGMEMPRTAKESVYQHCFYALSTHRLFSSYDAREVFLQCLEDVAWEVTRLREEPDSGATTILANRSHLFEHMKHRTRFTAAVLPAYEEVLHFVITSSIDYLHFQMQNETAQLLPSPLLLHIVGAADTPAGGATAGGGGGAPQAVSRRPAGHAAPRVEKDFRRDGARRAEKPAKAAAPAAAAPAPAALKMNAKQKKIGTCGECGKEKTEVFPSNRPDQDSGFYCAKCWSNY